MVNRTTVETYTVRSRRLNYSETNRPQPPTRFIRAEDQAAPAPRPEHPPVPFGDLSAASIEDLCQLATEILRGQTKSRGEKRRKGIRLLFGHLGVLPGDTWQERWEASGFNDENAPSVSTLARPEVRYDSSNLSSALKMAFGLRVIQPSLSGFRANRFGDYAEPFRELQRDSKLDDFFAAVDSQPEMSPLNRLRVKFDVTCALTTQGIALRDLTPSALLHYSLENKRLGLFHGSKNGDRTRFGALAAWEVLHSTGHFPHGTPPTLRMFIYNGQKTVEELVDSYDIKNASIRQLLIDYLARRRSDTDYITLQALARNLASLFWVSIEKINPGQKDLALSQEVYDQWRADLRYWTNDKTKVRKHFESILLAVRGFYVDLHSWAIAEPERWAQWVTPCPIMPRDLKGFGKRRRENHRNMADRTRVRQPLLSVLVQHVESRHEHLAALLEAGRSVPLGGEFTLKGQRYSRTDSRADRRRARLLEELSVRVIDHGIGETINVTMAEDTAFWEWVSVELLRHSGIRVEELTELTHLSIRQYQRPNGEVIALLVVAPSKTDRERVIPMSAELFHAVAQIVRRQTPGREPIPLVSRYDPHERVWSEPMPFLLQRQIGTVRGVVAAGTVLKMLGRTCKEIAKTNKAFAGMTFTPHDFRRLFATEVVNGGLPIHIGAALLGHLNLQTTQGYVAVFAEDIVGHYQEFLSNRRAQRPEGEYGDVTPAEWAEFEEHFDKRRVELGNCARPYGTPCQHEHACIRCPMLQINPQMVARLDELEEDLQVRRKRAEAEQWLGEIDGIDLTLTFLRAKRDEAQRLSRRGPVILGLPRSRPPEPE
ncbi:tyrosine-type recombinase/integrase [Streptomyces sp. NPDC058470]|uniref:tyrosine-type recombinase/integrase n=1 Tax=Streptomyces sp. NPDC058470 TaxID=3346515 RepID=UPI003653D76D